MTEPIVVPAKPWWRSRTLALNALGVAVLIVGILLDNAALLALPDPWVAYLTVLLATCNALLRFATVQPIDGSSRATVVELVQTGPDGTAAVAR